MVCHDLLNVPASNRFLDKEGSLSSATSPKSHQAFQCTSSAMNTRLLSQACLTCWLSLDHLVGCGWQGVSRAPDLPPLRFIPETAAANFEVTEHNKVSERIIEKFTLKLDEVLPRSTEPPEQIEPLWARLAITISPDGHQIMRVISTKVTETGRVIKVPLSHQDLLSSLSHLAQYLSSYHSTLVERMQDIIPASDREALINWVFAEIFEPKKSHSAMIGALSRERPTEDIAKDVTQSGHRESSQVFIARYLSDHLDDTRRQIVVALTAMFYHHSNQPLSRWVWRSDYFWEQVLTLFRSLKDEK